MKGSSLLKWTEKISGPGLWAIATTFAGCYVTVGFLSVGSWKEPGISLQILSLLSLGIAFAVLVWGFWGGVISAAGACLTSFVVSVVAGHFSGYHLERAPYFMECLLFIIIGYLCIQFLQREEVEEKADKRQLENLEEEYLAMAIEYGKREELLRVLEKKGERMRRLDTMAERLRAVAGGPEEIIQVCLGDVASIMGKGEVEVVIYTERGIIRHSRGGKPVEVENGKDEIDRWLDEHRTSLLVNNLTHDVRFPPGFGKTRQIQSLVAVPLLNEGKLKGTLRLTSLSLQAFSHEDLRFVNDASGILVPFLFRGE